MRGHEDHAIHATPHGAIKAMKTMNSITTMQERLHRLRSQDRGAAMVEYALLLVLVALAAFFTVQIFGDTLLELFEVSGDVMGNAATEGGATE